MRKRINVHEVSENDVNLNNKLFAEGCRVRSVALRRLELNVRDCIGCGFCGTGCAYDRKLSTAITYVPDAVAAGAQLIHHAYVDGLAFAKHGEAQRAVGAHVTVRTSEPNSHPNSLSPGALDIEAGLVIVSAGAVESPALLARSGVPDPYGTIGRGLVLHPSLPVGGLFDREIESYRGITGTYYSDEYLASHGFMLECLFDQPIDTAISVPGIGRAHYAVLQAYRRLAGFGVMLIDLPSPENRVSWDDDAKQVRIEYTLRQDDADRLRFGAERAVEIMFAAGASKVFLTSDEPLTSAGTAMFVKPEQAALCRDLKFEKHQTLLASAHAQATLKMSEEPRLGTLNSRGEVRTVQNLIVCDSSSFPASCGVNTMISIMTLARYQARRISAEWSRYAAPLPRAPAR